MFARSLNFVDTETLLRSSEIMACAHCGFFFVAKFIRRGSCKGNPDPDLPALGRAR